MAVKFNIKTKERNRGLGGSKNLYELVYKLV